MRLQILIFVMLLVPVWVSMIHADEPDDLIKKAREALKTGRTDEARKLADEAVKAGPKDANTWFFRGALHEVLSEHKEAVADFDRAIEIDPKFADAYDHRGSEQFKLGRIKESVADFDRFLQLKPDESSGHWKRGISLYYAGKFDEGKKQFEGYEKVDTNDVENAVWHFLCVARASGVEKARAGLLKIGDDKRVPMMKVYELFAGKAKPEDVLAVCREGRPGEEQLNHRLFYAHQYLGLYAEATGDRKKAREHMEEAVKHKIGHYMYDVARVHLDLLRKDDKKN